MRFVMGNLLRGPIRNTKHFRGWFHTPMNYARIMELPLTLLLLQATKNEAILDVSSPKLLALYYALMGCRGVVTADLEDYFVSDFETYKEHANLTIKTAVFDAAREIPYPDSHFDKIFSVSVLEHIPNNGDILAMREMLRVLKPSGSLVITLPAFTHYVEEWISSKNYWKSAEKNGKTFYQRRYDEHTLLKNFSILGSVIQELILIAESPIEPPRIGENGMMLHNSYYINKVPTAHLLKALGRLRIPFVRYLAELNVSRKCHYLTTDWTDPNIRQVVVKMTKTAVSE
jgi:SAM-dependent methyltransferase